MRSPGQILPSRVRVVDDDVVALLLQQLPVCHEAFGRRVRMDDAVGAFVVEPRHRSLAIEELEADEMIRSGSVRNRLDRRDVGQPPGDRFLVFRSFRRLRGRHDESR